MATVLVTGIAGQDGGYLAERLTAEGHEVHGLVTAGDPQREDLAARVPQARLHVGDLRDAARLADLLADVDPDEVYHLGGPSSVAQSWAEPVLFAEVVGLASARLLELAWHRRESGRDVRVLVASSAEVFGAPAAVPQDESTPLRPMSPYGAAKAYAQQLARVYRQRGLHVCTVVLYNHESPRRPPSFVTRKITSTVAAIARGRADALVLGNLDARRDWGWAPDYVDAMVRALRHPEAGEYVVATGRAHSVRDLVAVAFRHVGIEDWEPLVRSDPALVRPLDAPLLVGEATRAHEVLGWSPTVGFEQMVAAMVDAEL